MLVRFPGFVSPVPGDNAVFLAFSSMALKATIYKAELQVSDLDRGYYATHSLTIARHPSETDERMMVRLLAFALAASPDLAFGRGLSTEDEADLQEIAPDGTIRHWIDVGTPDERDVRRACHRAERVTVLTYGGRGVEVWWQQVTPKLRDHANLTVLRLDPAAGAGLAALAERTMRLQCTIQDGTVWLGNDDSHLEIVPERLLN